MAEDAEEKKHNQVLQKRAQELENRKETAEAWTKSLKKAFKENLKADGADAKLRQEMVNGIKGLAPNPEMERFKAAQRSGQGYGDFDAVDTGFVKRYWEEEDED